MLRNKSLQAQHTYAEDFILGLVNLALFLPRGLPGHNSEGHRGKLQQVLKKIVTLCRLHLGK